MEQFTKRTSELLKNKKYPFPKRVCTSWKQIKNVLKVRFTIIFLYYNPNVVIEEDPENTQQILKFQKEHLGKCEPAAEWGRETGGKRYGKSWDSLSLIYLSLYQLNCLKSVSGHWNQRQNL